MHEGGVPVALFIDEPQRPRIRLLHPSNARAYQLSGLATSVTRGTAGRRSGCSPATNGIGCGGLPASAFPIDIAKNSAASEQARLGFAPLKCRKRFVDAIVMTVVELIGTFPTSFRNCRARTA